MSSLSTRTTLEIGLLRLYHDKGRFPLDPANLLVDTTSPASLQTSIDKFCHDYNSSIKEIQKAAREVKRVGYLRQVKKRQFIITPSLTWTLFRSQKPQWDQIDGTISTRPSDCATRYKSGVRNKGNSYAIDVILIAAIQLDIGRIQIDQMDAGSLAQLKPIVLLLREIVKMSWGSISAIDRMKVRDLLAEQLNQADNAMFPLKEFRSAHDVAICLLTDNPQVTWTKILAWTCCDGVYHFGNTLPETDSHLAISFGSKEELQQKIMKIFRVRAEEETEIACSNGIDCRKSIQLRWHIVDRAPPTLTIFRYFEPSLHDNLDVPESIQLLLPIKGEENNVLYKLVGCLYFCNGNHFVLRWRSREDQTIQSFDGLKHAGEPSLERHWNSGLGGNATPNILFYRI